MDRVETNENTRNGVASLHQNTIVPLEDMMETNIVAEQAVSDASVTTSLQSPDGGDEDINTSDPIFATITENVATYHCSHQIIPQIHISIPLENMTSASEETATVEDYVTSGNNHISTSIVGCKSSSEDAAVQTWESSASSIEVVSNDSGNDSSTLSGHLSSMAHDISTSYSDNGTSAIEQAATVVGNISTFSSFSSTTAVTTADTFCEAPGNIPVEENSRENVMSTSPGISISSTVVKGVGCDASASGEAVSASAGSSDITSGETLSGPFIGDTFSPLCTEDISAATSTPVSIVDLMGIKDLQEGSCHEDHASQDRDVAIFSGDFTNNASPLFDPGEISHKVLKETSPCAPENTTSLPECDRDRLFKADAPATDVARSAAFQLPSTVISESTASLSSGDKITVIEGTHTVTGSGGSPAGESRMDKTIRDSCHATSAPAIIVSANACNASGDGSVYTLASITNTRSSGNSRRIATTDSGSTALDLGEKTRTPTPGEPITTLGSPSTIATVDGPFSIVAGNTSPTVCCGGLATDRIKKAGPAVDERSTTATVGNASKHEISGRTATALSSEAIRKASISREEAVTVSENYTITSGSINDFSYPGAAMSRDSGDNITREDAIAAAPESDNPKKPLSTSAADVISSEIHVSVKKTFGDTATVAPSKESTVGAALVDTKMFTTQDGAFKNTAGNITANYGSAIDSEDPASPSEEKSTGFRPEMTISSYGICAFPGNDTGTICRGTDHSLLDEITTGQMAIAFGNATISHKNTGTTTAPCTIPTNIASTEGAEEASTGIPPSVSKARDNSAETKATPGSWSASEHGTSSEEDAATTRSGDVTKSVTAKEADVLNFKMAVVTEATNAGVENSAVVSGPSAGTILGHPESSISTATSILEDSTDQKNTATAFGYMPNSLEGEHLVSVCREISVASEQESNFRRTSSKECTTAEATELSARPPVEDASSPSWSDISRTSMDVDPKNDGSNKGTASFNEPVTPDAGVASATFRISEVVSTFDNATNTAGSGDTCATGHTTVGADGSPTNKSRQPSTASGDLSRTAALWGDAVTIAPIVTEATPTVTAMTTQASSGDIISVSQDKSANSPQDTPELTEIVASENISASSGDSGMVTHNEVLTPETAEMHILGDTSYLVSAITPEETPNSSCPMTPTDTPAITSVTCALNDAVSTPGNATPVFENISSEGILPSRNDLTATVVDISIQNQATSPEISTTTSSSVSPFHSAGGIVTTLTPEVQTATGEVTLDVSLESVLMNNVNITNSHENVANPMDPCVGHRDLISEATSLSLDTNISSLVLGEAVPSSETFSSGNAGSAATLPGAGHVQPDSYSPAEAFSTLASDLHGHKGRTVTPSQSIHSTLGSTYHEPESKIAFGNSITPILPVGGGDLSTAPSPSATTGKAAVPANAAERTPSIAEETDSPGDRAAELSSGMPIFAPPTPFRDIIVAEENTTGIPAPKGTNVTTILEDIDACTGAASGDVRETTRKANLVLEDTRSIQYDASATIERNVSEEAQLSESTNLPKVHLTTRDNLDINVAKTIIQAEVAPADLTNHVNGNVTVNTGNPTPSLGDTASVSEDFIITGGTLASSKVTISMTEDSGEENEALASEANISLPEMPVTSVNSMTEMNLNYTEAVNTVPEPTTFEEDATLTAIAVSVTLAGDTAIFHSEKTSLGKPTDLSLSRTISSKDSISATLPCPRKIPSATSSAMSDSSSEDTSKETSIIDTILGVAHACTSASAANDPLEEILSATTVLEDTCLGMATSDTQEAPSSEANIALGKDPSSEATTILGEVALSGSITEPRENLVPTGFMVTSISKSASDSSLNSISESSNFPVTHFTHQSTFPSEQTNMSRSASSSKIVVTADITAVTTIPDSTTSSGDDVFTSCSGSKSDETHTSGRVIILDGHGKKHGPSVDLPFEDGLTVACEHSSTIQNTTEHPNFPRNSSTYPNTTENAAYAPENSSIADPEDTTIASGSRHIAPDDAISTTLDKLSGALTGEISTTTERALTTDSRDNLTAKPKEATKKSEAGVPSETESVPVEDYMITTVEETAAVPLRDVPEMDVETPMLAGEVSEESPGESVATNLGKIVEPTSVRSFVAPCEIVAVGPRTIPAATTFKDNVDKTEDACEPNSTVTEDLFIDSPIEIDNDLSGNIPESSTGTDKATAVIHRRPSAAFPSQVSLMPASGAAALPSHGTSPASVKASTIYEETLPDVLSDNFLIASTSPKTPAAAPEEFVFSFQRKGSTLRQVVPLSFCSIMLTSIMVALVLAVGLCMVIYYAAILVIYSTS